MYNKYHPIIYPRLISSQLTVLLRPVISGHPSSSMLTISKGNIEVGVWRCWGSNFELPVPQVLEEEVIVEPGAQISPSVARAALARVAEEASRQPMLVRRLARKHQVNLLPLCGLINYIIFPSFHMACARQSGRRFGVVHCPSPRVLVMTLKVALASWRII